MEDTDIWPDRTLGQVQVCEGRPVPRGRGNGAPSRLGDTRQQSKRRQTESRLGPGQTKQAGPKQKERMRTRIGPGTLRNIVAIAPSAASHVASSNTSLRC